MQLTDLTDLAVKGPDHNINGITQDSRQVKKGYLFAALPGTRADGRKFIESALSHGAVAILAPEGTALPETADDDVTLITSDDPRKDLALMAARFHKQQPDFVAAVTGTAGKTSTVHFTQQLWTALGLPAVSFGTIGIRGEGHVRSGSLTTPDPVSLHAELADLSSAGISHLAIEASSHGIAQRRLDGLHIKTAAFTNLSRDHLDYHPDMEDYFQAKARLFTTLLPTDGVAVLNADVDEYEKLRAICDDRSIRVITYGYNASELRISRTTHGPRGQELDLKIMGQTHNITLPLVGGFQAMNALCALGMVMAEAPDDNDRTAKLVAQLENLKGAPGRLQLVDGHPKGAIYVDYAHKPEALRSVLKTLRPYATGRLICVIGCGGDRDAGKRPIMGQIATELSDVVVITDDNPRSEDPATIRQAILDAAPGAKEIANRRQAITWAIQNMGQGDVCVIAGKGHERGQIIGQTVEPFDDVEEARKAIDTSP